MPEKVTPVLLRGQELVDAGGHECTQCRRKLAAGEQAVCTPPSWPSPRYYTLTCAACYAPPGRNERFTDG